MNAVTTNQTALLLIISIPFPVPKELAYCLLRTGVVRPEQGRGKESSPGPGRRWQRLRARKAPRARGATCRGKWRATPAGYRLHLAAIRHSLPPSAGRV